MDQDKKESPGAPSKGAEPSFSQIQKAAELLKIKRFAQSGAASAAPAAEAALAEAPAPAAQPSAATAAPAPAAPVAPVAATPAAPAPVASAVAAPAPAAPAAAPVAAAPAAVAAKPAPVADKPTMSHGPSIAEPVSMAQPAAARAAASAPQPAAAPAVGGASRNTGGTVPHPEAQAAAADAEPSLPADYAELKRQALLKAQAQMPQESRLALPVGTSLQEYNIEWTLGIGGFGITYLALDTNLEAEVAIKEYFPSDMCARESSGKVRIKTPDEEEAFKEGLDKFLKECRVLANFKHANVVRVSRFFQANNTAYMVMEYESGESFKDWLAARKTIDEALLLKMIMPLLDGLDVVHKAGFLHRDIKPANIFVRQDDSMVLLDFGAARHAVGTRSRSLTTIVTPGYAPFEQYHSHGKQGPWTDLYAFGGMMYWVITGSKPVEAPARIKNDAMIPASKAGAGRYSPALLAAIDWALVPDENKRPQSVSELKAALTAATPVAVPVQQALPPVAPQPLPKTMIKAPPRADGKTEDRTGDAKKWWKPWGAK
ncbi:MAG: tyrosine kinase family protein [Betaproteobacteria bacterium]|nr:tyrosine kinase family protein [Betaproteobacteria bacterium]